MTRSRPTNRSRPGPACGLLLASSLAVAGCGSASTDPIEKAATPDTAKKAHDAPPADAAGSAKKPGEAAAAGLEAKRNATGLTVAVGLVWNFQGEGEKDNLQARVKVTGDEPKRTVAFGMLQVTKAQTDGGHDLTLYEGRRPGSDPRTSMRYRNLGYPGTDPQGFEIAIEFVPPPNPATTVTSLEATCLMRVFGKEEAIVIEEIGTRLDKPLAQAALDRAGVELVATWNAKRTQLVIAQKTGALGQIGEVGLTDAAGMRVSTSRSTNLSGKLPVFEIQVENEAVLANAHLRLTVYEDLEVLRAEISAKDIPVPVPK